MTTESSRLLRAGFLLTAALLFSAATAAPRGNAPKKPLAPKAEGITRLVTYNVGVFNKYIADDYPLITAMMQEIDADAVCMNELDSCANRTGRVFQLGHIAELLGGWDVNYGAAMPFDGGKYGVGIVSREKALRTFSVVLEKGAGAEPRALVVSEFERFVLATAHLDHVSAEQQAIQAATINRIMQERYGKSTKPVFLGGDMNATPDSETLRILRRAWKVLTPADPTYPSNDPRRCIDYIFQLDNGVRCGIVQARVLDRFEAGDVKKASDHLPVVLDIRLDGE